MPSPQAPTHVLSDGVVEYLRSLGQEQVFAAGATIIERGDPGRAFYVVRRGEVEIRLAGEDGHQLSLARLGPGSSFGEMALLRQEPISATVQALTDAVVLECPASEFKRALAESEDFRTELMARLAQNLQDTSAEAWASFQRAEALQMLIRLERPAGPIVADSVRMQKVEEQIGRFAGQAGPVLITGEAGVGKLFAARKLHEQAAMSSGPLIVVDCPRLNGSDATRSLLGCGNGAAGGEKIGVLQVARGGTLVLRRVEALDGESQERLAREFEASSSTADADRTRVIATTRLGQRSLSGEGGLAPRLAERLGERVLAIPRLADRKQDVLPLTQVFLQTVDPDADWRLTHDAEHAILSLRYGHRNVAELRDAVELAALFAEEGEIRQEHVFAGPRDKGIPSEFELGRLGFMRWLVAGRGLAGVQLAVLGSFAAIALACLLAAGSPAGHVANALIWGAWEPALIFLFLFLGHLWCTVCPLSTAGRYAQRAACLGRPPPPWLKRHGVWLAILGFFLIIWTERVFHMTSRPWPSGLLLTALLAAAMGFAVVYRREVWCRYVCPLGALASCYSLPAAVHVRANASVCATCCTTHECYQGGGGQPGCPVFHHPLYASESHHCKLCLGCLRNCPHDSARLYLRPPLQAVWVLGGLSETLTPFALAISLFSIVMLGWTPLTALAGVGGTTLLGLSAIGLGVLLSAHLPRMVGDGEQSDPVLASKLAFGLLVLAWGPLMAYQLGNVPGLNSILVLPAPDSWWAEWWAGQTTLLIVLQVLTILLAVALAAVCLWRIRAGAVREGREVRPLVWRAAIGLAGVYTVVALGITLAGGAHP